jgi:hypothetical protein
MALFFMFVYDDMAKDRPHYVRRIVEIMKTTIQNSIFCSQDLGDIGTLDMLFLPRVPRISCASWCFASGRPIALRFR